MATTPNRLDLDFSIDDFDGRNQFLHEYVKRPEFQKKPLTQEELEMCANYLLWGKDENGKNAVQRKELQIETKNKTWCTSQKEESLEALLESPTFNENQLLGNRTPTKIVREVFSREKALANAPEDIKKQFVKLFNAIDELDLLLNFYDVKHGKRQKPPRSELLNKFDERKIAELQQEAETLKQYSYLKLRHQLVELRREQFVLKDSYTQLHQCETINLPPPLVIIDFDAEVCVLPVGVKNEQPSRRLLFLPEDQLVPANFSQEEIEQIVYYYWQHKAEGDAARINKNLFYFDFRDVEHVYQLLLFLEDVADAALSERYDCQTKFLLDTLDFYIEMAEFDEVQREILDLKIHKVKNEDIAAQINQKYGKTYSTNYISTIFKQKIVVKICEAAEYHEKIIQSLSVPEEFKKCNTCGRLLLLDSKNFVRKTRSKDGFVSRCKECDKIERRLRKGGNN